MCSKLGNVHHKYLLVVVGPTAVGKTSICIDLAVALNAEIISADSRQFYQEMNVGTAKPSIDELSQVPHHLINSLSIHDDYNIVSFEKDALAMIDTVHQEKDIAILTGGSGLYVKTVCEGIDDVPKTDEKIREELNQRFEAEGLSNLLEELKNLDPVYFKKVDRHNPQRIIRALEVCLTTGQPFSSFLREKKIQRPFKIIKVGLERERSELYQRIDERMDQMINIGLFEEAKKLYPFKKLNALQTVGYKEIFDFMDGVYDESEAVRLLKRNSRRYAKRQFTWFKKDDSIQWFHPDNFEEMLNWIRTEILNTENIHHSD
ncbi:tRNA (adenosine(37)-N6)-dimethylallyltransferase MiaA [Fulvivirgaceae bacterium BMA10]|uniref:tRNA dimethylallyltransferase n=1 Tax=Splendidivirga corallicola TaxID=3051826 RepID=A0ABT8KJR1_9BACT|nr:tRNA (adenosine(37)-N6)-dimethylallyltransferase MiaA [Fulvivirgaceae bacterium BMA10]